jgi:hypothetical protein
MQYNREVIKRANVGFTASSPNDPRILEAIDNASLTLSQETMDSMIGKLDTAIDRLRESIRRGAKKQSSEDEMYRSIRRIVGDPSRAAMIAATEPVRMVFAGQMLVAKEQGAKHKKWLASAKPCPICTTLQGKVVQIGRPFYNDRRGTVYSKWMHPPGHPYCDCECVFLF